jgi:hypothetical protein
VPHRNAEDVVASGPKSLEAVHACPSSATDRRLPDIVRRIASKTCSRSRRIEEAARRALQSLDRARLPEIARAPFRFVLTFQNDGQARAAAMLQGAEALPDTPAVQILADDFENGYRRSLDLMSLAGLALQLQSARAAIQTQPNAAAIQKKAGEITTERWLQPPVPAPPAPPTPPRRYYGAR